MQLTKQLFQGIRDKLTKKQGESPQQLPEIESGGGENHVQFITDTTTEMVTIHSMLAFAVPYHRFNR